MALLLISPFPKILFHAENITCRFISSYVCQRTWINRAEFFRCAVESHRYSRIHRMNLESLRKPFPIPGNTHFSQEETRREKFFLSFSQEDAIKIGTLSSRTSFRVFSLPSLLSFITWRAANLFRNPNENGQEKRQEKESRRE